VKLWQQRLLLSTFR